MIVRSAFAELRAHPGRFAAVCLAIVLGVAFAAATLVFTDSFDTALGRSLAADVSKVDVVVTDTSEQYPLDLKKIAAVPGVQQVEPSVQTFVAFSSESARGDLKMTNIPENAAARWYSLSAGRWPAADSEMAVDLGTAARNSWTVGSRVTLGTPLRTQDFTVTAILDTSISPLADSSNSGYAGLGTVRLLDGSPVTTANVVVAEGISAEQVASSIQSTLGATVTARTAAGVAVDAIQHLGGNTEVLTVVLLAFVALAGLVAAMVVANTFTILITQRRRQIALLRCIGATGPQVRRAALTEAALVAVAGSLLGIAVGVGMGRIVCAVVGIAAANFTVDFSAMAVAALAGIVVTVISALAPTARTIRIAPMAALRPVDSSERVRAVSRWRIAAGLTLFLGGGVLMSGGVYAKSLGFAIGGGALTAVGVLVLLRVVLPRVLAGLSGVGGMFGATGRLAVANTLRNPGRAAATCSALLVGVGAIATLLVAAASAQAGADQALGARNPLDLQVTAAQGALPTTLPAALKGIDGVQAVITVPATDVELHGEKLTAFGPSVDQLDSVRNGGDLAAGEVALPKYLSSQNALHTGDPVTLRRGSVSIVLRLAAGQVTDDGSIVLLGSDLQKLDPAPIVRAVWGKIDSRAAPNEVIAKVNKAVAPFTGVDVSGSGAERAATADVLNTLITVALALLAVAVVIAVVGIGNTLGLSVVERTQESALLRALGLRRAQLRFMLAIEAALLALVAAAVGTFFGIFFGWAAVAATFGQAGRSAVLSVPTGQLLLVCAAAILAGVLASVLPGRSAARTTPVQALVEV